MLALLIKTATLAGLLLLSAASPAAAELRQGPTGVEYVRRFEPSPGPNGQTCTNQCPVSKTSLQPVSLSGSDGSGLGRPGSTVCTYNTGSNSELFCYYDANSGVNSSPSVNPTICPENAGEKVCTSPPPRRKRSETKLERVVRERQWKPVRNVRR